MAKVPEEEKFLENIQKKSKFLKRFRGKGILWQSIAAVGVIGWMIAIPTVAGTFLGKYIDSIFTGYEGISWTITFMLIGLAIGIYSVWRLFYKGD